MKPAFVLHERLATDCFDLGHFPLCRLVLMNDRTYPWFILVPERSGIREIFELDGPDRQQFLRESCDLAAALVDVYRPDKLNIAAIGNLVPQLHLHHVVRYREDRAWPGVVWGRFGPVPYDASALDSRLQALLDRLPAFTAEGSL